MKPFARLAAQVLIGTIGAGSLLAQAGAAPPAVFRITPVRPVAELRAEALRASPLAEAGPFRPSDLVEVVPPSGSTSAMPRATTS